MSVPVLSCPCGLRMKAKGATPGRIGRCPKCGRTLTVPLPTPDEGRVEPGPEVEAEAVAAPRGYGLTPTFRPAVAGPAQGRSARPGAGRGEVEPAKGAEAGPRWWPDLFFPLRGAEGVLTVAMLGLAFWGSATLTPELALTFVADASRFDAGPMGWLVAMIASMPGLLLGLFAVAYALQYLGRVLVSGAMGEPNPPRPPDRNVDGLSTGLAPWLIWLACGASVGLGPLAAYVATRGVGGPSIGVVAVLAAVGLPYAAMALLMTFLHDGGFPRPIGVVGALARFPAAFLGRCAVDSAPTLVAAGPFVAAFSLREGHFWAYLPLMLPCWMLALWAAVVAIRGLGIFYHRHASDLRWHREKPWWGVTQDA